MKPSKLEMFIDQLGDILSSGQDGLNDWHTETIQELFSSQQATPEEKKEVFENFYSDPEDCVTIEEIKWMMEECGVEKYTISITV